MQKIKTIGAGVLLCLAVASNNASGQTPTASSAAIRKDNISTVDMLLKIENVKALEQSKKESQALGLEAPPANTQTSKKGANAYLSAPASLYVDSISGVGQELRADVSYSGTRYERVRVGAQIGPCRIKSIVNRRVTLIRISNKNSRSDQCPLADWTGIPSQTEFVAAGIDQAGRPQARPLPAGMAGGMLTSPVQAPGAQASTAALPSAR